jgi:citrate synthase
MAADIGKWETAIAEVGDDDVLVRGYRLSELTGSVSYTEAAYLVATGELPRVEQRRMLDAILVSLIDHGISPSSIVARMLASCGTPVQASLAGGMLSVADWHGGAGEQVAYQLAELVSGADGTLADAVAKAVRVQLASGRRFEGFGHPQHPAGDPRALRLLDLADELRVAGEHVRALRLMSAEIAATRRPLGVNVNGAVAAVLLDLGFAPGAVRGVVIAARSFGLLAHVLEEREQGGRWRHAGADAVTYTGPAERPMPCPPTEPGDT